MDTDRDREGIGTWTGTWTGLRKGTRTGTQMWKGIQKGTGTFLCGIKHQKTTAEFEHLSEFETEFENNLGYESRVLWRTCDLTALIHSSSGPVCGLV